jgi:hypothetical protein
MYHVEARKDARSCVAVSLGNMTSIKQKKKKERKKGFPVSIAYLSALSH